jgi:hypothetical protein
LVLFKANAAAANPKGIEVGLELSALARGKAGVGTELGLTPRRCPPSGAEKSCRSTGFHPVEQVRSAAVPNETRIVRGPFLEKKGAGVGGKC